MKHTRSWTQFKCSAGLRSQNEHLLHALLGSGSKTSANWRSFSPFAAPPPPFNRKTERSSRAAVALFLCLLFSWHKQSPLTLCCHFVKHRWQTEASHSIVKHAWADSFWTLQTRVGMSLQNIWLRSENPNDALDKSNRSLCFLMIKPSRWIG